MDESILLPVLVLISLIAAVITLVATPRSNPKAAGPISFVLSLIPLGGVLYLVSQFPHLTDATDKKWYFNFTRDWFHPLGLRLQMGADTISLWLIVLTAVLTPIAILASFNYIKERQREFYAWMLA